VADANFAALDPDVMDAQGLEFAALEVGGDEETDLAAAGLRRPGANRVEMDSEVLGVQALAQEGEELFALDDGGVALLDARHELHELVRRVDADLEEALDVGAGVWGTWRVAHLAVNFTETRLPGYRARHGVGTS